MAAYSESSPRLCPALDGRRRRRERFLSGPILPGIWGESKDIRLLEVLESTEGEGGWWCEKSCAWRERKDCWAEGTAYSTCS